MFHVSAADEGKRIDVFLSENIDGLTRSRVQRLIQDRQVLVNGMPVTKSYKISANDAVTLQKDWTDACQKEPLRAQDIPLEIVYEDEWMLAVSKKASLVTHPACSNQQGTLANALLYHIRQTSGTLARAGIIHRLDKDTSGLILVAKDESVHAAVSEQFKKRTVQKEYIALVAGSFQEKKALIDMPIGRSRTDRKKMAVMPDAKRKAVTEFEVLTPFEDCTLLRVFPKTGRTHQIRVHLSYIGHPVVGDAVYGNKASAAIASRICLGRQFLHACAISFFHPVFKKTIHLRDETPEDLKAALKNIPEAKTP